MNDETPTEMFTGLPVSFLDILRCLHDHFRDGLYVLIGLGWKAAHEIELQIMPAGAEE